MSADDLKSIQCKLQIISNKGGKPDKTNNRTNESRDCLCVRSAVHCYTNLQGISYSVHDAVVISHLTQMTQRCFPSSDSGNALPPPSTGNGQYDSIQLHMHVQRSKTSLLERWLNRVCWAVEAKKQQSRWLVRPPLKGCLQSRQTDTNLTLLINLIFILSWNHRGKKERERDRACGRRNNELCYVSPCKQGN